jgi:putative CocE/NonD family hydrolase
MLYTGKRETCSSVFFSLLLFHPGSIQISRPVGGESAANIRSHVVEWCSCDWCADDDLFPLGGVMFAIELNIEACCGGESGVFRKFLCLCLWMSTTVAVPESWGQATEISVEHNVAMKTRDGVTLRADIYRPAGDATYPVLLQRTPYDKNNAATFARTAAARGYMVVVQDVRGRYTSDGEWYTFKHEGEDGYDTIEWAAALPHSNGKVGMFGGSYVGATQMLAAVTHPPHLAGICPVVTASNYHENWTYQGGAFEQWFNQSWTSGLAQDTFNRTIKEATDTVIGSTTLPLTAYPLFNLKTSFVPAELTKELAPYYLDWLAHPEYDSYWKQWAIDEQYASIQVPALTVAAWYDIFQGGSLRNYVGLRDHAGNEAARKGQRLLVAVGGHAGVGRKIGAVDFGPEAEQFDENKVTLEWYDYLLLGKQNEFASPQRVRLFVMGENKWRNEDDWPLARARETKYFLQSSGRANTAAGDGSLVPAKDGKVAADEFVYDPMNPVPTVGGPLCCDPNHLPAGPRDQRDVEARPDVLVYSTPTLDREVEVTGPVTLDLFAKSSAVDTDFTAKLVDVGPDGFAQNLTEGILRAHYRESRTEATAIVPGQIYEYQIDLWSTSNVFLKGHKIRLEVSSSNFPRFDRNLNTGKLAATSDAAVKATNTIYHDAEHPSALLLPVVPR